MLGYSLQKIRRSEEESDVLYMTLKLANPTLVLDCGANKGDFSKTIRKIGYKGPIWCFEPNRDCVNKLNSIAEYDTQLRVFPIGTGSSEQKLELQVAGKDGNMGSLLPHTSLMAERFRSAYVRDKYEVTIKRLDSILDSQAVNKTERIFLKMDTQGYDCETFKGLGDRVNQVVAVKTELSVHQIYKGSPSHWEMLDLLREHDFEPILFSTISRNFDGKMIEYDALFVRNVGN
jgi:FkbM family methyltransferase